jgi:hypothetical protein
MKNIGKNLPKDMKNARMATTKEKAEDVLL